MYLAFFDRNPDTGGLKGWLEVLQKGGTREGVLEGFLFSKEFMDLVETFGISTCAASASYTDATFA